MQPLETNIGKGRYVLFKSSKMKKWTSLLIAVLMAVSILTPGLSTTAKAADAGKTFDLIEITDFHGALLDSSNNPVGAVLAQNINDIKAKNPDRTLIMGGGDLYQGTPISNVLRGVPVQKAFTSMGMEVATLGNHEFDWGLDTIINTTLKGASYSIVCANMYDKAAGKRVFDPYKIITKDGVKIALIGAITKETPSIVMPSIISNYTFTDAATEINTAAKEIKDGKLADVIIALVHAGNDYNAATGEIFDIAGKLTNVSAVFGGHTHSILYGTSTNGIPVYIANNAGKGFIDAKMTVNTDGTVSFPVPSKADYIDIYNANPNGYKAASPIQDPAVKAIVDAANIDLKPIFDEVIGTTATDLTRTQLDTPYGESYLGIWAADVVKNKAGADIGVANNGGIRIDVPKGNITVGTIFSVMPFDNEINVVTVNKAQLKAVLEQAVMDGGKGIQISGIKFTYDMTKPALSRITSITREDGTAISDTETLKLAGPDFVLTGGDGFTAFTDPAVKATLTNPHILVRDAFIENVRANGGIKAALGSRITSKKYISVLATSDLHGSVYPLDYFANTPKDLGLAKISTYVTGVRAANPNVMLIDNGDTIQGTPLVTYYNLIDTKTEYPMMKVMGAMKYDTWTLGNHEFNFGLATLNRIIADAKAEGIHVLSANTVKTSDGNPFVDPYYIKSFTVNGKTIKVAVVGLTTKNVPGWEDPAHYAGLQFNDLVTDAQKWVNAARSNGADVVIVAAHSGEEGPADTTQENQIKAIATKVTGIDAIVAGHAHSLLNDLTLKNPAGKTVPVVEPKNNGTYVSRIDIAIGDDGKVGVITTSNVVIDKNIAADKNITDVVAKPYQDATLTYVKTKIGTAAAEYNANGQLIQPTAIMDLVNEVQRKAAGTQLSIAAPLSNTAKINKGDVTIQDIMSVYVYENFLYGVKMNGKQIKAWLEWSVRYFKQTTSASDPVVKDPVLNIADYNLDQLYGATYDVDLTQPVGSRIKNLRYNGKPMADTDVFTVAINNYRYNGGGGFMAAAGLSNTDPSIVTYDSAKALGDDGQVRNLMIKYVQDNKTITPTVVSTWKISAAPVKELPKTGSPIDMESLIGLGSLVVFLGIMMLIKSRKEKEGMAA